MFPAGAIFSVGAGVGLTSVSLYDPYSGSYVLSSALFTFTWETNNGSSDNGDMYFDGMYVGSSSSGTISQYIGSEGTHTAYVVVDGVTSNTVYIYATDGPTFISLSGDGSYYYDTDTIWLTWTIDAGSDSCHIFVDGSEITGGSAYSSGDFPFYLSDGSHYIYVQAEHNGVQSNTINMNVNPPEVSYPTEIYLDGNGSTYYVGDTFYPTWTVDSGSDYAAVYDEFGTYYGSGSSGEVGIYQGTAGTYNYYVQAGSGSYPTSSTTTIYVYDL